MFHDPCKHAFRNAAELLVHTVAAMTGGRFTAR